MKKIITAINNPKLNEELKKENNFEIIGKDIQYKEAILEILENNKNIDLIIISEKIPGEIKLEKIIEKIKIINEKIKIIFILEKENIELEKILIKNNIKDIYYNNKINLSELIKIINKKEINMEEEIIKLRKIIEEKNINDKDDRKNKKKSKSRLKNVIENKLKKINNCIKIKEMSKLKFKKTKYKTEKIPTKIITFSGNDKSGKTTLSLIISQILSEKKYKVLIIDGDFEKEDLTVILKGKKYNKKRKNKKYFNKENIKYFHNYKISNQKIKIKNNTKNKRLLNKNNKIYYYKIKNSNKLFTKKINKNLYFNYGLKILLENKKLINKKNYDFIIIDLSKRNKPKVNRKIVKNSDINFLCMEANFLGIREIQKLLILYEEWNIDKNRIYIIKNKSSIISMNTKIILKYLKLKNRIFNVKENKFYHFFYTPYLKRNIRNKTIKKDINKIINTIIYNKKK